jgi:hypothetical protein
MREEGIFLSLVRSKEASDIGIVGWLAGFFPGIQWKVDTGGNGPMREEGILIYLSLVRSKEASDVGIVVEQQQLVAPWIKILFVTRAVQVLSSQVK